MILNLFKSRNARQSADMCKHVRKLLAAQRDILSPQAIDAIEGSTRDLENALKDRAPDDQLEKKMKELEAAANKWLKPYPNASIRENVEVLLVALAVAMAIRTFFVQPFKIPTGSMQPTLFGVMPSDQVTTLEPPDPSKAAELKIPGPVARFCDFWVYGDSYYNILAPEDGRLQRIKPPQKFLLFNLKQDYQFNDQWHTIWFPADNLFQRAGLVPGYDGVVMNSPEFKAGQPIVRFKASAGDHLFVDRISYNFRRPTRGEIIVFETKNIPGMAASQLGQFYIKRLVVLGGEKVSIGDDRHLVINGVRLDKNTPHFENVYGFDPAKPPRDSQYSGHLNEHVAEEYHLLHAADMAPLFPTQDEVHTNAPDHYMVMGDNTCSSYDSRVWGEFPREDVIGKYFFVYWPFGPRWGWNVR